MEFSAESEKSQTIRVVLGSLLIIAVGLLLKLGLTYVRIPEPLAHLFDMAFDAVIIAGIVAALSETPIFKNYLEARLKRYAWENFVDRATNDATLRAYSRDTLHKIEGAVQRALLPQNPHPDIGELYHALNDMRERVSIWRTGWIEYLTWKECPGHDDLCVIESDLRMNFINGATDTQTLPLAVSDLTLATLADESKLYELVTVAYNNKPLTAPKPTVEKDRGRTTFTTPLPDQQLAPTPNGGAGIPFRQQTNMVYTRRESRLLEFSKPVKGFEVILEHPKGVSAEVVVFGIGGSEVTDPLPPKQATDTHHHWKYSGWLLDTSGVIITFSYT